MAILDPFSTQIVKLVRDMPDEAILELVRHQLGIVNAAGGSATLSKAVLGRPKHRQTRKATKAVVSTTVRRGKRATSAERQKALDTIERLITKSRGLSAGEIAKKTKLPKGRVQSAVRELKHSKRIFQGGNRRFARYAGDAKTAKIASVNAQKGKH